MRRTWAYPTEFLFSRDELLALQAWRESGHLHPNCIKCGEPVRLKNDCQPVCAACAFRLPPMHGFSAEQENGWMDAYLARARTRAAGRPSPSCWELFSSPAIVLSESIRVPDHVCEFVMQTSTLRWANDNLLPVRNYPIPQNPNADADAPDWDFWQLRWPLPVGVQAIEQELEPYASLSIRREAVDENYVELARSLLVPDQHFRAAALAEHAAATAHKLMCSSVTRAGRALVPRAPFPGVQRAVLALRVEIEGRGAVDIFGLGTMAAEGWDIFLGPLDARWADGAPVAGDDWKHPILRNAKLLWSRVRREHAFSRRGPAPLELKEIEDAVREIRRNTSKQRVTVPQLLQHVRSNKSSVYVCLRRAGFQGLPELLANMDSTPE